MVFQMVFINKVLINKVFKTLNSFVPNTAKIVICGNMYDKPVCTILKKKLRDNDSYEKALRWKFISRTEYYRKHYTLDMMYGDILD